MDRTSKTFLVIILFSVLNVECGMPNGSANDSLIEAPAKDISESENSTNNHPKPTVDLVDTIQIVSVPVTNDVKRVDNSLLHSLRSILVMVRSFLKRSKFFAAAEPSIEWIRLYIRSMFRTYRFYRPEQALGKCIVQCFHVAYPNLMRRLQIGNIISYGREFYSWMIKFINNAMNVILTDRFDENDGFRIGSKIAAVTQDDTKLRSTSNQYRHPLAPNSIFESPNYYYYYYNSNARSAAMRSRRDVQKENNVNSSSEIRNGSQKQSYPVEPLSDASPIGDDASIDPDAKIMLTNLVAEEEAEKMFDIETMVMKTLGIEDNIIKKYTLMYCAKEYTMDVLDRFIDQILLD